MCQNVSSVEDMSVCAPVTDTCQERGGGEILTDSGNHRVAFWGVIRALLLVINIGYPNHLSAPH
jgi:hypothetical protein